MKIYQYRGLMGALLLAPHFSNVAAAVLGVSWLALSLISVLREGGEK